MNDSFVQNILENLFMFWKSISNWLFKVLASCAVAGGSGSLASASKKLYSN